MYVTLQTRNVFHSKAVIIIFVISLFVSFFRYSFQYRINYIRPSTQFINFCRRSSVETMICLGPCTFTLRGLRFVDVGIIYPILGKVLFQISFTNYENILAHNTALVTSGNSGLPRFNSSRKSSDIPLPTQSPIWVNPMGPITVSFGKKCYNHAVSGNRIMWVYAGFWWYHGILVVHLQDSVGAFWAIKDRGTSIRGLFVENVMTEGLSRVCSWWCMMLFLIIKITGIYFVGDQC